MSSVLLGREGSAVSEAIVGRILKALVERGAIQPVPVLRRRPRPWSPKRRFAVRLPRNLRLDKPGGLVQLDTVFVNLGPEKPIKHFTAYDPVGKAYNRATAAAATSFLDKLLAEMPFTVEAIQVDGGSAVKAECKQARQAKGIRLYELPPKRPQLNGAVSDATAVSATSSTRSMTCRPSVEALNPILNSLQHLYQSPPAPRRSCRSNPGAVPQSAPSREKLPVSNVLIPDTGLPLPAHRSNLSPNEGHRVDAG